MVKQIEKTRKAMVDKQKAKANMPAATKQANGKKF